jgi:hypothetical protein
MKAVDVIYHRTCGVRIHRRCFDVDRTHAGDYIRSGESKNLGHFHDHIMNTRRKFLTAIGSAGLVPFFSAFSKRILALPISCNSLYMVYILPQGRQRMVAGSCRFCSEFLKAGLTAIEPSLSSSEEAGKMIAILRKV